MFKLKPDATFVATVKIPNGDTPLPLTLIFRRKSKEALAGWIDSVPGKDDLESLGEIVEGWKDVDAPFSPEAFAEMLSAYTGAGMAIFTGYLKALSEAERKN